MFSNKGDDVSSVCRFLLLKRKKDGRRIDWMQMQILAVCRALQSVAYGTGIIVQVLYVLNVTYLSCTALDGANSTGYRYRYRTGSGERLVCCRQRQHHRSYFQASLFITIHRKRKISNINNIETAFYSRTHDISPCYPRSRNNHFR